SVICHSTKPTPFPYTTLFRSAAAIVAAVLGVLTISTSFYINYRSYRYHKAVMISQKGNVKQNPDAKATVVSKVYNGYVFTVDRKDRKSTRLNSSHVSISYAVF